MNLIKNIIQYTAKSLGYKIIKDDQKNTCEPKELQKYKVKSAIEHNTSESMNTFFNDNENAQSYIEGRQKFYNTLSNKILTSNSLLKKGDMLCDVGCGPGDLLNSLSKNIQNNISNEINFCGFDHSEKALEIGIKRFPNINFKKFNIYEDYKNYKGLFDLIICSEVIEHLLTPKVAVLNLLSMMKIDGTLIITVPEGRADTYLGHINFWSPESWEQFINNSVENIHGVSFRVDIFEVEGLQYNYVEIRQSN